jgi:ParB/Sulfiredoxin domain
VSEFEHPQSVVPAFSPAVGHESFVADAPAESDTFRGGDPFQREGLPPGYRMRHDRHYVDQLTNRSAVPHVRLVPLGDIDRPQRSDVGDLGLLVRSIGKHGVLQPLLVRPRGGRFELIAGGRRLAAAVAAGLTEVPCLIHQVDEIRARALAEADNLRIAEEPEPATASGAAELPSSGLKELSRSFSAIGSCLHLLADRETALRDRVALDLVRTEVHRAGRLAQCLMLLAEDPPLAETTVSVAGLFQQVAEGFAPERRLSGAALEIAAAGDGLRVRGDQEWLGVGLSGALGGMLAVVEGAREASVGVRIAPASSGSSVMIELEQRAVTIPPWALGRVFDPQWTERPGGYQAAVELAASRRVMQLHGGGAEAVAGERGGCRLVLLLPAE